MFFIGIFGIETKNQELKELNSISCPCCHQTVPMTLFKHYYVFHFFFIPLIKWKMTYYVVCSNCEIIATISKEKGEKIEAGEELAITYWDLEPLPNSTLNLESKFKSCAHCHQSIDSTYEYCPHCGTKQLKKPS